MADQKTAIITGITGQDGSYLAEFLIEKGYKVVGVVRRSSSFNTHRLRNLQDNSEEMHAFGYNSSLSLEYGDVTDAGFIGRLVHSVGPDEYYNLGAQSHVRVSFDSPSYTSEASGNSTLTALEALKNFAPECRFYQASSSEMFGATPPPQNEEARFYPRSPYGIAKLFSYWTTVNYREAYGIRASNGILFNHESPGRGESFVTKKIATAAAKISLGIQDKIALGNLNSVRDWGYAPEYVGAMWAMLQAESSSDYVIATGKAASVRQFGEMCFALVGLKFDNFVTEDPRLFRPTEVDSLVGDASKAKEALGWEPQIDVTKLADIMVRAELDAIKSGRAFGDKPSYWGLQT